MDCKGGRLTERLRELREAGFIAEFAPWKKERGIYYRVIDEYTLFWLSWIAPKAVNRIIDGISGKYWETISAQSAWKAWSGFAFESVCLKHTGQIRKALHVPDGAEVWPWRHVPKDGEAGAQVDLVFDRPDGIVNLCEIKYCVSPFVIDKKYASVLLSREKIYSSATKTRKQIFHSMIVSGGLKKNVYSEEIVSSIATLKDLFDPGL